MCHCPSTVTHAKFFSSMSLKFFFLQMLHKKTLKTFFGIWEHCLTEPPESPSILTKSLTPNVDPPPPPQCFGNTCSCCSLICPLQFFKLLFLIVFFLLPSVLFNTTVIKDSAFKVNGNFERTLTLFIIVNASASCAEEISSQLVHL